MLPSQGVGLPGNGKGQSDKEGSQKLHMFPVQDDVIGIVSFGRGRVKLYQPQAPVNVV